MAEATEEKTTPSAPTAPVKRKANNQLDLLLLKAENYSKFILENQERSKAMMQTKQKFANTTAKSSSSKKRKHETSEENENTSVESGETGESTPVIPQPPNLVGGKLLPHQLEGLQWLLSLWENGLNGILADEMGLGKTIQIISLIAHLRHHKTAGPYLIAAPLATISNWKKEFEKWLPSCPVVLYHGTKPEREELRKKQLPIHTQKSLDFPIVITSFEICIADRAFLERYVWQYIILDEGHRIKNRNCKLLRELKSLQSISRLLLTGTPIQNSLEELWSLLNFCSPMIFDDLAVFQSWFDFKNIGQDTKVEDIISEEERDRIVTKLHEILRPFVLRRLKKDTIADQIQPKKEIVVYCGMTDLQRDYYRCVLQDTLRETLVAMGVERAQSISQINQLMNLRKVCNHPLLFGEILDRATGQPLREKNPNLLIQGSGKFKLLYRMLPRLKREGRKVILFSQMTEALNLIEDLLDHLNYNYLRLDGSTKLADRQSNIELFNDPQSDYFIFLLSTRAGGLGINLTAADTAILFDSDWNPHMDSQAQDRCHRIGQRSCVVVYRLVTSASVEVEVLQKALSKKKLERLAIAGGDFRKAGMRASQQVSIEDLRRLLEDDVKSLATRTSSTVQEVVAATEEVGGNLLRRDISEEELALIMDRERLFAGELKALESLSDAEEDEEGETELILKDISEAERVCIISESAGGSSNVTAASASAKRRRVSSSSSSSGRSSASARRGKSSKGSKAERDDVVEVEEKDNSLSVVPAEGEMYDIVSSAAEGILMSLA